MQFVYRVLFTGLPPMLTGEIEANLLLLNEAEKLPFLDDHVALSRT